MSNWLTPKVQQHIHPNRDTVLDVCCGIGNVMDRISCKHLTAVDIYRPYVDIYRRKRPDADVYVFDVTSLPSFGSALFDVIVCLDGLEHLEEKDALQLIEWMEEHASKKVIIFTPVGLIQNCPVKTWGIPGGDAFQIHRCGFQTSFFLKRGYTLEFSEKNRKNRYDGTKNTLNLYVLTQTRDV